MLPSSSLLLLAENHLIAASTAIWQHIWLGQPVPQQTTNTPLPSNTPDTLVDTLLVLTEAQHNLRIHINKNTNN